MGFHGFRRFFTVDGSNAFFRRYYLELLELSLVLHCRLYSVTSEHRHARWFYTRYTRGCALPPADAWMRRSMFNARLFLILCRRRLSNHVTPRHGRVSAAPAGGRCKARTNQLASSTVNVLRGTCSALEAPRKAEMSQPHGANRSPPSTSSTKTPAYSDSDIEF